jgi:CcmD family protein
MSLRIQLRSVLPVAAVAAALLLLAVVPESGLAAQEPLPGTRVGTQNLRPYWHVFAAYAIVIALIGGWAFSIARRLRNLEERLVD